MYYSSIEEARSALTEVILDVTEDQGEDAVEAAYHDLVNVVAEQCTPEVAAELRRIEGVEVA